MSDAPDHDSSRLLRAALGFPVVEASSERRRRSARRGAAPSATPPVEVVPFSEPVGEPMAVIDADAVTVGGDGVLEGLSIRLDELLGRMAAVEKAVARLGGRLDDGALDTVARATATRTAQGVTTTLRQELVSFSDRLTDALQAQQAGADDERLPRGR